MERRRARLGRRRVDASTLGGRRLGGASLGLERVPVGLAERILGAARLLSERKSKRSVDVHEHEHVYVHVDVNDQI